MDTFPRRIWQINRAGSLDRLRLIQNQLPAPGEHEARVRLEAVGLNFADVFACLGLYSATPRGAFIPGLEYAGVVECTGSAVLSFKPGDRVMGGIRFGGYATCLNVDARYLYPLPTGWSSEEGAAFPVQVLTAWYALAELGAVRHGSMVLVHSAAGGVGLQALAILHKLGARVVATVGRPEKVEFLLARKGLSREQIIVRDPRRFSAQLENALSGTGARGFDVILDSVAGEFFQPGYRRLNPGGRLILYGAASMMPTGRRPNYLKLAWSYLKRPRPNPLEMISENKSIMGFNLIWLWKQHALFHAMMTRIMQLELPPPHIGARFPFEAAPQALRHLQSGVSVGKVVLSIRA